MTSIKHINHSSLLVTNSQATLITDPWYFVNAFHGWAQFPQPDYFEIQEILLQIELLDLVIISHAHEDHIDPLFLGLLTSNTVIICPKVPGSTLKRSLVQLCNTGVNIIEVSSTSILIKEWNISCLCNNTLTKQDFIFLVYNDSIAFIHANDNWHKFSDDVIDHIVTHISHVPSCSRYLFSQVGVADSFPLFYDGIGIEEKKQIISNKCLAMISSILWSAKEVDVKNTYAYANQSLFEAATEPVDPYLLRDSVVDSSFPAIRQLVPSSTISRSGDVIPPSQYIPLVIGRLASLSNEFAKYCDSKLETCGGVNLLQVVFLCKEYIDETAYDSPAIRISTGLHQWNRILAGQANLESVLTGGCGRIYKPANYNMHKEYDLLVNWAYLFQANVKLHCSGVFL